MRRSLRRSGFHEIPIEKGRPVRGDVEVPMTSCQADGCDHEATVRLFWPGREPIGQCKVHAEKALRIASAMGFYCHAEET